MSFRTILAVATLIFATTDLARATDLAPPLLDISASCGRSTRNSTAMSECVVAESEARAELLTHWAKYTDAGADRCIKLGRKAKRQPYVAMAKCLEAETAVAVPAAAPPPK